MAVHALESTERCLKSQGQLFIFLLDLHFGNFNQVSHKDVKDKVKLLYSLFLALENQYKWNIYLVLGLFCLKKILAQ